MSIGQKILSQRGKYHSFFNETMSFIHRGILKTINKSLVSKIYVSCELAIDGWVISEISRLLSNKNQIIVPSPFNPNEDDESGRHEQSRLKAIRNANCTIVIVGEETGFSDRIDREIHETLKNKNGLVAFSKPGMDPIKASVPPRLLDNLESGSGYAKWHMLPKSETIANRLINLACNTDRRKIRNSRLLMT